MYIEAMSLEVNKLHRWLQEFTLYASPIVPILDSVNINTILEHAHSQISIAHTNIEWKWTLLDSLPNIELDPALMDYVWQNLFVNSIESIEDTGHISITTKLGKCKTGSIQGQPAVEVRIVDSGSGMSKVIKQNIFIPFYSTKADGDGIGLAMVERIIKAHNAEIEVLSEEDSGSTFVVRLPIWHAG